MAPNREWYEGILPRAQSVPETARNVLNLMADAYHPTLLTIEWLPGPAYLRGIEAAPQSIREKVETSHGSCEISRPGIGEIRWFSEFAVYSIRAEMGHEKPWDCFAEVVDADYLWIRFEASRLGSFTSIAPDLQLLE